MTDYDRLVALEKAVNLIHKRLDRIEAKLDIWQVLDEFDDIDKEIEELFYGGTTS